MKFNYNIIKYLLLILLTSISFAQDSCKGGLCRVSLDSLDDKNNSKNIERERHLRDTKNKEGNEKTTIKLAVK